MKKSSSFEIPVSLVKQYLYCPRIPYFVLVLGIRERVTELMVEGKEEHGKMLRRLKKKGWNVNTFLKSEKYGVYGYVDAFRKEENGYAVLELKNTDYKKKIVKMHIYQAAGYALLVEENFGRVYRLVVKYRDGEISRPFTSGVKNFVVSIINKIRSIDEIGLVSTKIEKVKCNNCGFSKKCLKI